MVDIFIENIIASATVSGSLDLNKIIETLPNCEYDPDRFPGLVFRPGEPPVVILLFNNGKMMVTAAKSVDDVQKGMDLVEAELEKAGLITPIEEKEHSEPSPDEINKEEDVEGEDSSETGSETVNDSESEIEANTDEKSDVNDTESVEEEDGDTESDEDKTD